MTTPTGTITMADVNVELGYPSTAQISLNDAAVRALAGIPSGTISMNDLRGKSNAYSNVIFTNSSSPRMFAYTWTNSSGFGSKYADPSTIPGGAAYSASYNPSTSSMAVGHSSATGGYLITYPWSSSGFGTAYASPSTLPANVVRGVSFSPDGASIATASANSTPFVRAYPWSSSGYGTAFSTPPSNPTAACYGVSFKADSTAIAVGGTTNSPFIHAWQWSSSTGWGTKYANPATATGTTYAIQFCTAGGSTVVATGRINRTDAYAWNNGWGTKFADPGTYPTGTCYGIDFSADGTAVALGHSTSPFVTAYPWSMSSGYGTKYADPSTLPLNNANDAGFNKNSVLTVAYDTTIPRCQAYTWSSSGFGTAYTNPAQNMSSTAYSVLYF